MNKTSEMKVDHFEWNLDEKSRIYIYIYIYIYIKDGRQFKA